MAVGRTGAVMLSDTNNRIVGLFTDSDLVRLLENRHDHLLDANIADFITTRFKSVPSGMPLIDAIQAMRERRISELPVIDTDGCPLGMLDITDVLSAVGLGM